MQPDNANKINARILCQAVKSVKLFSDQFMRNSFVGLTSVPLESAAGLSLSVIRGQSHKFVRQQVVGQFEAGNPFSAKLSVWLSDLCGFACLSTFTAKYAKDFAKIANKLTDYWGTGKKETVS